MSKTGPITLEEIVQALSLLGGEAQAKLIKDKVTELRGGMPEHYGRSHSYRETIQKKIEDHCPQSANYKPSNEAVFEKVSRGIYKLIKPNLLTSLPASNVLEELKEYENTYIDLDETTRKRIIDSRIGQGDFRSMLISQWDGCSVTGCRMFEALSASHIKPWRSSNNKERLDVFNGLLLIPNLDKLFDRGLITFKDDRQIVLSQRIDEESRLTLGLNDSLKLRFIKPDHITYLQYHRQSVFL
jgi:hypothetical protein